MIRAAAALQLPAAKLTDAQRVKADRLEHELELHVRKDMEFRGVDIKIPETDGNVIAEVNQRLKAAGYAPSWQRIDQPHPLNKAVTVCAGWFLSLSPSDEAYREARETAPPTLVA